MNNEIKIFNSDKFGAIRTAGDAENPMFCLADLCKVLELQVTPTKNRLKQKGVTLINTLTNGGSQKNHFFSKIFLDVSKKVLFLQRSNITSGIKTANTLCGFFYAILQKINGSIECGSGNARKVQLVRLEQLVIEPFCLMFKNNKL